MERLNRTIKTRIWTYLSDCGTVRWVDIIQDFINAYNLSRNRSIGMALADVQKKDKNCYWVCLLMDGDTHLKPWISHGAMDWASSHKTIFDKDYMPNLTKEHLIVRKVVLSRTENKRCVYKWMNDNIKLLKASGNQKRFRKFQTTNTTTKTSCGDVLYLTAQRNYFFLVERLARQVTLVDKENRQVRCRR